MSLSYFMADGNSIHVPHPDFVALRGVGAAIVTFRDSNTYAIVDLSLITHLEVPDSSRSPRS